LEEEVATGQPISLIAHLILNDREIPTVINRGLTGPPHKTRVVDEVVTTFSSFQVS
jgi:hypothetical protein